MTVPTPTRETQINNRIATIHRRLTQIAEIEANGAWAKGYGSNGELDPERQRLIDETDRLLDELSAIRGSSECQTKP